MCPRRHTTLFQRRYDVVSTFKRRRVSTGVIYDFIGEMIFCWNHYRYALLKSVGVSKRVISEIYIRNKNTNLEKESPGNILNVKI